MKATGRLQCHFYKGRTSLFFGYQRSQSLFAKLSRRAKYNWFSIVLQPSFLGYLNTTLLSINLIKYMVWVSVTLPTFSANVTSMRPSILCTGFLEIISTHCTMSYQRQGRTPPPEAVSSDFWSTETHSWTITYRICLAPIYTYIYIYHFPFPSQ